MKKIIAAATIAVASLAAAGTVHAGPPSTYTGTLEVASVSTWGEPVVFDVTTDPTKHVKDTVNYEVDDMHIRLACTQAHAPRGVLDFAIWVTQTGTYSGLMVGSPSLAPVDPSQPGDCQAHLIHTTIKGKNHTIEVLDTVAFTVG